MSPDVAKGKKSLKSRVSLFLQNQSHETDGQTDKLTDFRKDPDGILELFHCGTCFPSLMLVLQSSKNSPVYLHPSLHLSFLYALLFPFLSWTILWAVKRPHRH